MSFFRFCRWSLAALPVFLVFISCDKLLPTSGNGELVPVKIRAVNVSGGSQTEITTRASGGEKRIVGQPIVQDLGDGMLAEITVEEDVSALRDGPQRLAGGKKFRVIAIDATTKKLYSYADYTVPAAQPVDGEIDPDEGSELHVLDGNSYNFICISYNSATDLPPSTGYEEGEDLPSLSASVSQEILYWREEAQTVGSNLSLSIVLRPQFVKVTLELDAGTGKTITAVADNSINLDAPTSGSFNLPTGDFTGSGSFSFSGWTPAELGVKEVTSGTTTFLPKASEDYTLSFDVGAVTRGGTTSTSAWNAIILNSKFAAGSSYTIVAKLYKKIADKFAGSNIYWDGQKLTFDNPGVTTNQYCQGVFFKWGSLIGISPAKASSGDDFNSGTAAGGVPGSATIDGTPIYLKVNGEWKKTNVAYATSVDADSGKERWFGNSSVGDNVKGTGGAWSPIPYGSTAGPYGKSAYTLLTNHSDFAGYLGDICNYLKSGYRMPTMAELELLGIGNSGEGKYTWTSTSTDPTPAADGTTAFTTRYGTFFGLQSTTGITYDLPLSGQHGNSTGTFFYVGRSGFYWSGSADSYIFAHSLAFSNEEAQTNSDPRSFGYPVRCVLIE